MKQRVFIAHGWDGYPGEGWFPWLKKKLEAKGFAVFVPQLPEAGSPRIYNWVQKLAEVVGTADENTYVPLDNQDDFRDKLNSAIIVEKNMGHFSGGSDGVAELPVVLESILQLEIEVER